MHTVHGMKMQSGAGGSDFLWTTDSAASTVSKWDPATGARLATIGSKGTGLHPLQFGSVADVAFDATGAVYVSDGDGGINARVAKLDKTMAVACVYFFRGFALQLLANIVDVHMVFMMACDKRPACIAHTCSQLVTAL